MTELVLSIFPGIDMLGIGFEEVGFCVVRGPDLIFGGDIRRFHPPPGVFAGVVGGSPCQDFSRARRAIPETGYGREMLAEFGRVVTEASPDWWLLENVDAAPDFEIAGYSWQRLDFHATMFGSNQNRLRHFQFGHREHLKLVFPRGAATEGAEPCAMATEGRRNKKRPFPEFCQLQGLSSDFDLPGFTVQEKYRAVGNGVPIPMAIAIARAVKNINNMPWNQQLPLCKCTCGRPITGRQQSALPACRKRVFDREREADRISYPPPAPPPTPEEGENKKPKK